jgi:hypothetical protein
LTPHFRVYSRHVHSAKVQIKSGVVTTTFALHDLGLGGAGLAGASTPQVGARVQLRFTSPTRWDPLMIDATVIWSTEERFGVQFSYRNERDLYSVYEFLGTQIFEE